MMTVISVPFLTPLGAAGAVVAAYYAAVGLTMETLVGDARVLKGRHLVAHSLALRSPRWLRPVIELCAGIIPRRLHQLESSRFGQLRHGVSAIGIVCHDLTHDCARYLATGAHAGVSLYDAVATSASIPLFFRSARYSDRRTASSLMLPSRSTSTIRHAPLNFFRT